MKKLTPLKRDVCAYLPIGISNLAYGITAYLNLSAKTSLIISIICLILLLGGILSFFFPKEDEDELSEKMRVNSAAFSFYIGCLSLIIVKIFFQFLSFEVATDVLIAFVVAFFIFLHLTILAISVKKTECRDDDFFEENEEKSC